EGEALKEAITMAKLSAPDLLVQVEVDRLDQISPALEAQPDALLLDNFSLEELREGVAMIGSTVITEASGNITLESAGRYKELELDFISSSALVSRAIWCDVGLDWLR
ncbi:MAG: nicotinate-nucleotide diphosphorylase (carboxylating), partial [Opitutales bacterium]